MAARPGSPSSARVLRSAVYCGTRRIYQAGRDSSAVPGRRRPRTMRVACTRSLSRGTPPAPTTRPTIRRRRPGLVWLKGPRQPGRHASWADPGCRDSPSGLGRMRLHGRPGRCHYWPPCRRSVVIDPLPPASASRTVVPKKPVPIPYRAMEGPRLRTYTLERV